MVSLSVIVRDISLTMGAEGLLIRWGDHSILRPYFWGDHSTPDPIYGGINKSWRDHKIDLMGDHGFKIFADTLSDLLFM